MRLCFFIQGEIFLRNFPWIIRTDQMLDVALEQSRGSPFNDRRDAREEKIRGTVFTTWYINISLF